MEPENRVLIAAVIPQFLERGVLWFRENEKNILRAAVRQSWWQKHVMALEAGATKKISDILRRLNELGYGKVRRATARGEFSHAGDTVRIAAINRDDILRLEFHGAVLERIVSEPLIRESLTPKPKLKTKFLAGEFVVHIDHGIGIYRGMIENERGAFHKIEYGSPRPSAEPDALLVPAGEEKRLSLYIGFAAPSIHRLGNQLWTRTKQTIKESAAAFANELLKIYAAREQARRAPRLGEPEMEEIFAHSFPYVETPAQSAAIREILADMAKPAPMDRILAGDVGFGKTEVALRAVLRAALSGHQAAVLAPTTILVEQHARTFKERFSGLPISIETLSRLTEKPTEQKIIARLKRGEVDVIIGTHRLLSRDIEIPKLGLLVIDEEQRFGVRQKEHFKKLRAGLDILSLSATPIPRTLSLAMAGLRGISQVNDPPPERIAVKNFVLPWHQTIVKNAIEAELERHGQTYILHNRVETIDRAKEIVAELAPGARFAVAHGRMDERKLLETLEKFRERKIDVLIATTIIENGLDFANVNTLIVENATRLGLAQAYQIRGRIGRGDRQAYAYFLYPASRLTPATETRLKTLTAFEALGSGYEIALRDLEMRGAGAVLGRAQSGAVQKGGLNLYCQLLNEALDDLRPKEEISVI